MKVTVSLNFLTYFIYFASQQSCSRIKWHLDCENGVYRKMSEGSSLQVPRRPGETPRTVAGWLGGFAGSAVGLLAGALHGSFSALNGGKFSDGNQTCERCIEAGIDMGDRNNA